METLERMRSGRRMPLLILGEAGGRWKRLRGGEDGWSDVSRENLETDEKSGELGIIRVGVTMVENQKDQSDLKPEYSKAPARITSKTASSRIFSRRRSVTSGFFAQITVIIS